MKSNRDEKKEKSDDKCTKCGMITCAHYAAGFCVNCDSECNFIEMEFALD